jgi:hypothetical protein
MALTQAIVCYPGSAEHFRAVEWSISTPISEVLSLGSTVALVRVRDADSALVISVAGTQRTVQIGQVVRLNTATGAVKIYDDETAFWSENRQAG